DRARLVKIARGDKPLERLAEVSPIALPTPPASIGDAPLSSSMHAASLGGSTHFDPAAPSIAVLPFLNLSDDVNNEYFADGLAEELLNVLAKIPGLRVASRTSAFSFKGNKEVDLQTIARKLNVATLLEGSVRTVGRRVRITAQLVQASSDSHLWSET